MRTSSGRGSSRLAHATAYLVLGVVLSMSLSSAAQVGGGLPIGSTPRPTPTPTPTPTVNPSPTASPNGSPLPSPPGVPGSTPTPLPSATPGPSAGPGQPTPTPSVSPVLGPEVPPGFQIPILPRTPGRNTSKLVGILERVTQVGIPLEQALQQGMGRFPVGGLAFYSDDWMNPRYTPVFHLHEGVDIFAEFGTPIRSPDKGVVSRRSDGPIGGISVWVTGTDGTQYYFAHMQSVAPGIDAGTPVEIGSVLGFVGDSGNAGGGAPHLHFEVHKGTVVPPKPFVDAWLDEAERAAPAWVEERMRSILGERALLRSQHTLAGLLFSEAGSPASTPEYSVLLTLLDPVAGSVGMLPDLPMVRRLGGEPESRLVSELIRMRIDGSLLVSLVTGFGGRSDAG